MVINSQWAAGLRKPTGQKSSKERFDILRIQAVRHPS